MLKAIARSSVVAAVLLVAPSARADKPEPRKPPAELDALKFLVGSYKCTGSWYGAEGAAVPRKSSFHTKWILDGWFLSFDYKQPKGKDQPMPIAAEGYFGWDAAQKKYSHGAINNAGMSVLLHAEPGADALVFKGQGTSPSGASPPLSITFKKADKGFTILTEEERNGKMVKTGEETCTK